MHRYLIAGLIYLVIVSPAIADDAISNDQIHRECETYPDIPIHVIPLFEQPDYDMSRSIAGLQTLASDTQHSIHEKLTLGLTRYEPVLKFEIPIRGVKFPNGLACAHVDHVDVTIGYRDVVVFIANEIAEGTCGYNEVMGHEQKHIAVNRAILEEYVPIITNRLRAYLSTNGVFHEQNPENAIKRLHDKLQIILGVTADQMVEENEKRQQEVDTPAEYQRVSDSCHGQLQTVVAQFRHGRQ